MLRVPSVFFLTALGISAVAVIGSLTGALPLAATIGIVAAMVTGFLLVAGYSVWVQDGHHLAAATGRNTTAFRSHVDDLHQFASSQHSFLVSDSASLVIPVDLTQPIGECFRSHYPEAATALDDSNAVVLGNNAIREHFAALAASQAHTIPGQAPPGCVSFLRAVGEAPLDLAALEWDFAEGDLTVRCPGYAGPWLVAGFPTRADFAPICEAVWNAVLTMNAHPTSLAFRAPPTLDSALADSQRALARALLDHNPEGECSICSREFG